MFVSEKFYNGDTKIAYLDTIPNLKTRKITAFPFMKAKNIEEVLGKDMFEMNLDELGLVIENLSVSTHDSAYISTIKFKNYIDWAIENGYKESSINPLSRLENIKEWSNQFVAADKQNAFTRQEILSMCENLINYVDRAVLLALFEGINGEGFSELLNLRTKYLKEENDKFFARLYDNSGRERRIEVSKELFGFLHKTDMEEEYINKNGLTEKNQQSTSNLLDSTYIFKKTTRGKREGNLDVHFVNRKFRIYKEIFGLKYLKSRDIEVSGMMYIANELYKRDGQFKQAHLEEIGTRFNSAMIRVNKYDYRNTNLIKNLIKIKYSELYGYDLFEKANNTDL